ncbi:MAG: endo-1,4-beta-xylanase [Saprospiraceae bacterium]|nr:endo-1,4-beta-xylanase [Saprospiraceae bacterium]
MRKNLYVLLLLALFRSLNVTGQDQYHLELLQFLKEGYDIEDAEYIFYKTEQEIVDKLVLYGNASRQLKSLENFNFSIQLEYEVKAAGSNIWDSGINIGNQNPVNQGDIVLITFWARQVSQSSEVMVFAENASDFRKEVYLPLNFTPDWTQYFIAFKSSMFYQSNALTFGFHIAAQIQEFHLGGLTAFNLGQRQLNEVPSSINSALYGGHEPNAAWRDEASRRIEDLRKKDLVVKVQDANGNPIKGATVKVEMQKHEFGFGSAVVGCRFPGNRCFNANYVEKVLDLDGRGHGFNVAVTENALKWDGWEEEWIGTPEETVAAIQWLNDHKIKTRGHTLIWPGWDHLPDDLKAHENDLTYLRNRIHGRIEEMLTHPVLSKLITEWDVLNEITQVRDLEMAFASDPAFTSGREIYPEILDEVSELQPDFINYINDYVVLSGGGAGKAVVDRYKTYLDEIVASGAKFDGIGFPCHIGTQPTSIVKIEQVLDEFYARYGKRMKITEYDINENVDDSTQAKYLADFLTMIFSHPGVDAFLMWGFWDGNHWKNNASLCKSDWTLKVAGQGFIDKVFNEWWTNEDGLTGEDGQFSFRALRVIIS